MVKSILISLCWVALSVGDLPFGSGFKPFDFGSGVASYTTTLPASYIPPSDTLYVDIGAITYYDFGLDKRETQLYSSHLGVSLPFLSKGRGNLSVIMLQAFALYQELTVQTSTGYALFAPFVASLEGEVTISSIATESEYAFSGGVSALYRFTYLQVATSLSIKELYNDSLYSSVAFYIETPHHTFGREAIGVRWDSFYREYSFEISTLFTLNQYLSVTLATKSSPLFISLGFICDIPDKGSVGTALIHHSDLGWSEALNMQYRGISSRHKGH